MERIIKDCIDHLRAGGVIAYPTDTVWGLGVSAENEMALDRLFSLKRRSKQNPMSILVSDIAMAEEFVVIDSQLRSLLNTFWPGPVTCVLPSKMNLPKALHGGTLELGVRCIDLPEINELISKLGRPITTTSANLSGSPSANNLEDLKWLPEDIKILRINTEINKEINKKTTNKIQGSSSNKGSTVIKISEGLIQCLREGDFSVQTLREIGKNHSYQWD